MPRTSTGPWYRTGAGAWYATVGGKQIFLLRGPQNRTTHLALARTGARPHELAIATAELYNRPAAALVYNGETKTANRTIYLSRKMAGLVRHLVKEHPRGSLFRDQDGLPWTPQTLAAAVRQVRDRLKIKMPITPSIGVRSSPRTSCWRAARSSTWLNSWEPASR
jgi:hypothetical protein